jgi:hypothetical protein
MTAAMTTRSALILTLLAALCTPMRVEAQSAGVFARMGFGARGLALGNALVADLMGEASPYYNPALAPFATGQNIEASAAVLSLDRELQFLQFAAPIQPSAGIAAGLIHAGVTGIDGRDNTGYHTRDYATDEFAFFLAFGTRFSSRISAGAALQLFRSDLIDELEPVNSLGLDVGLTFDVTDQIRLGLALDDLLARYSWDTSDLYGSAGSSTSDRFPVRLRAGGALLLLEGRLQLLAEYESRFSDMEYRVRIVQHQGAAPVETDISRRATIHDGGLRIGAEYRLIDVLTVRSGLDRLGAVASGTSPSAGFMIEQPVGPLGLRGEYAFVLEPHGTGAMHLITLRIFL